MMSSTHALWRQRGELEAGRETFGVSFGGFAIDQQSDAFLERQGIDIRRSSLLLLGLAIPVKPSVIGDAQRIPRAAEENNTQSFPYEPLVMAGRLVMPAELQRVHRAVLAGAAITEDMRAIVEKRWPELAAKLPSNK